MCMPILHYQFVEAIKENEMKKWKNLWGIIIVLLLCTGCSIDYNLEITQENVKETIKVNDIVTNERSKETIYNEYNRWIPAYINSGTATNYDSSIKSDKLEYHTKEIEELQNGYNYTYQFNYSLYKYADATAPREAFQKRKFYEGEDYIIINTDKTNLLCNYSYFDKLKVTINYDNTIYHVDYTNADKQSVNSLEWNLDKSNCNDSEILLKLNKVEKPSSQPQKEKKENTLEQYIFYIFLIVMIVIIYVGYRFFSKIAKQNDDFGEDD